MGCVIKSGDDFRTNRAWPGCRCQIAVIILSLFATAAQVRADSLSGFLKAHCGDCHSGKDSEGGLDLTKLRLDFEDPANFEHWERVHDRVNLGEMPPKSAPLPTISDRTAFTELLATELTKAHHSRKETVLRRLNRREYENTLNDTFGTNQRLAELLPEDGRSHEFDNVAESLGLSLVQIQGYLDGITTVLENSIQDTVDRPASTVIRRSYADTQGASQWLGKIWLKRDDGAVVFFKDYGYPTGALRETSVQQEGWYKIRVTGYAHQSDKPITFALGASTYVRGLDEPTFGYFELPPKLTTIEITAYLPARFMIEVTVQGITDRFALKSTPAAAYRGPGLAIQHIEVEGPLVDTFPSQGHRMVFDGLTRNEIMPRNPADRARPRYVPKFEVVTSNPERDVRPVLERIATKAFRRPALPAQVEAYHELFRNEIQSGSSVEESLRTAITAIYCAPEFLYLQEAPGRLDDFALASRLSYFLVRSAPDEELMRAAAAGRLSREPNELVSQAERLLAGPRSKRFISDFTDAWLNLREIDFTIPDSQLFPEHDAYLRWSMVEETRAFFRKLIDDNLGVQNIVHSDFAMLNSRLAEHYGIDGVDGPEIRQVQLPKDSVRGGLLAHAAVLKVSANGTNTSPVVRGVWVMERILGDRVPSPPPGIPGVEPDIRGATTLRQRLDRHRELDSCNACHQLIDPPGFALECFDPIGAWRERFRTLGGNDRVKREVRGQKVRYTLGPPVDASGHLNDGRAFDGYVAFRSILASQPERLARALTRKLLTFATGREMGFSDRKEIERIVEQAAGSQYGIRDLIRLVVASETFQTK